MKNLFPDHLPTQSDRKRLKPYVANLHKTNEWIKLLDPTEEDLFKALHIERTKANPRCRILETLLFNALRKFRNRVLQHYGCPLARYSR